MTTLYGDTGLVSAGPLKTFTLSYPSPRETLLTVGTNEIALPTTEPTTGTSTAIAYTVQTGDLPTYSPTPFSVKYSAYIYQSGKNTSGSTVTINYSVYKNSSLVVSSTQSVANNLWWTHSHYRNFDVVVGDVIEARVWCTTAGVYLDYYAFAVIPTRIQVTNAPCVQDLTFTFATHPILTLGVPQVAVGANWNVYPTSSATSSLVPSAGTPIPFVQINTNINGVGYAGKVNNGDASIGTGPQTHATNHPYYYRNSAPSVITFREVSR